MTSSTPFVFVIDDDESVRRGLKRFLRSANYQSEVFESAMAPRIDLGIGPAVRLVLHRRTRLAGELLSHFQQICAAVRFISIGPDLAAAGSPRAVPVLITCGSIEENRFNNEAMAAALRRQHHPVTVRIVPDAHNMICWRDSWFPALDNLVGALR